MAIDSKAASVVAGRIPVGRITRYACCRRGRCMALSNESRRNLNRQFPVDGRINGRHVFGIQSQLKRATPPTSNKIVWSDKDNLSISTPAYQLSLFLHLWSGGNYNKNASLQIILGQSPI